jgi:integrase
MSLHAKIPDLQSAPASSGAPLTLKGGADVAKRRYQRGSLRIVGTREKKWEARWREDVISTEGEVQRLRRADILGTLKDYPTRKLALRELERRVAPVNRLDYRPKRISTFAEFSELWLSRVASQHKPSTRAAAEGHLRTHLVPKLGTKIVCDIDSFDIQTLVSGIRVKASKKAAAALPPSGKTVKNIVATISMMHRTAVDWGLTDREWVKTVKLPEWVKPDIRHFTLTEAQRVINSAQEPFKTFFWLIAETGMRLGEACALRPRDFRLDIPVVIIRFSTWRSVHVGTTKSKAARTVGLSSVLAGHMRSFMAGKRDDEFVFARADGTPWQGDHVVRDRLKPLLKQLGIPAAGAHAFRHLNASLMDESRTPDKVRAERLGHIDFNDVTLSIYTHAESKDHRSVAEQLGKMLAPMSLAEMNVEAREQ